MKALVSSTRQCFPKLGVRKHCLEHFDSIIGSVQQVTFHHQNNCLSVWMKNRGDVRRRWHFHCWNAIATSDNMSLGADRSHWSLLAASGVLFVLLTLHVRFHRFHTVCLKILQQILHQAWSHRLPEAVTNRSTLYTVFFLETLLIQFAFPHHEW